MADGAKLERDRRRPGDPSGLSHPPSSLPRFPHPALPLRWCNLKLQSITAVSSSSYGLNQRLRLPIISNPKDHRLVTSGTNAGLSFRKKTAGNFSVTG